MELRLAFFSSHNGSNVRAILENLRNGSIAAEPRVIISNNPHAGVFGVAAEYQVPAMYFNEQSHGEFGSLDEAILSSLKRFDVNLILLAGYMKRLSAVVIEEYRNRILNIHPALLPKYGGKGMFGMHVHEAVIASDDVESGATVHVVNEEYDAGRILAQVRVPRYLKDTPEYLAARVLRFEHVLYSQALRDIQAGLIDLKK